MKKFLILFLTLSAIIFISSTFGCRPGSANQPDTSAAQEKAQTTSAAEEQTSETELEKKASDENAGVLDIHVWEGYLPEKVIEVFENETGIKLNITLAADNGTMITLLEGGGKADIIMPTQNQVNRLYEQNLASALDIDKIPNYKNIGDSFKNQQWSMWDGSAMGSGDTYVIPYVFGTSGIVVNTARYRGSLDNAGWEILFDKELKGRVSARNSAESVMICLDLEDIPRSSLITDTESTLEKIKPKVIELKENVLKFYGTGAEIMDMLKNEEVWVSHMWDGGGRNLMISDPKFKYILPSTGGLGWTDTFMIPASVQNEEGAYKFLDFMLRDDIAAIVTEEGNITTVSNALEKADIENKEFFIYTDEQIKGLVWQLNFPQSVIDAYTVFWEEISLS